MTGLPTIEFEKELSEKFIIHKNIGQEIVLTTVDKVRICLMTNRDYLTAQREWLTPLGLFLSLLTTLVAAEFKSIIFKPDIWFAIYLVGSILTFVWLCGSACRAWGVRGQGTVDSIVNELKAQTKQQSSGGGGES